MCYFSNLPGESEELGHLEGEADSEEEKISGGEGGEKYTRRVLTNLQFDTRLIHFYLREDLPVLVGLPVPYTSDKYKSKSVTKVSC